MSDRSMLTGWKEIAAYLNRGIRTAQRWELNYGLPVHRPGDDFGSVYAFADEIDAWLSRNKPSSDPYVRPTFIVLDVVTPNALSDLKLSLEGVKYNVLTAFSGNELLATAQHFDVDGFVIDSLVLDLDPSHLGSQLSNLYPRKPRILISDDPAPEYDKVLSPGDPSSVVQCLVGMFGNPRLL